MNKFEHFEDTFFETFTAMLDIVVKERKVEKSGDSHNNTQFTVTELLVIAGDVGGGPRDLEEIIKDAFKYAKVSTQQKFDKRRQLSKLLGQVKPEQRDIFWKMYPDEKLETFSKDKIDWAITQCENTIKSNKKKKDVK